MHRVSDKDLHFLMPFLQISLSHTHEHTHIFSSVFAHTSEHDISVWLFATCFWCYTGPRSVLVLVGVVNFITD